MNDSTPMDLIWITPPEKRTAKQERRNYGDQHTENSANAKARYANLETTRAIYGKPSSTGTLAPTRDAHSLLAWDTIYVRN